MRQWRHFLPLGGMYVVVVATYLGSHRLFRTPLSLSVLIGLSILTTLLMLVWLFLRWMSPLRGVFGNPEQEMALIRAVERELSRSLRHGAPLVIVALEGKRGLSSKSLSTFLRTSDLVLRGQGRRFVLLMTETPLEHGNHVLERLVARFPVRAAVIASEQVITPATNLTGFGARHQARIKTAHAPTLALLRGLQLGLLRATLRIRKGEPPPIYQLTASDIRTATASTNERVVRDLTRRVA